MVREFTHFNCVKWKTVMEALWHRKPSCAPQNHCRIKTFTSSKIPEAFRCIFGAVIIYSAKFNVFRMLVFIALHILANSIIYDTAMQFCTFVFIYYYTTATHKNIQHILDAWKGDKQWLLIQRQAARYRVQTMNESCWTGWSSESDWHTNLVFLAHWH